MRPRPEIEATIVSPGGARTSPDCPPAPALVAGSSPELSSEILQVLQDRLRVASLLLFGGFSTYLLKTLLVPRPPDDRVSQSPWLIAVLGATVLITGLIGWRLSIRCPFVRGHLRLAELLVFGSSALLFLFSSHSRLTHSLRAGNVVPIGAPWLLLLFTYALLIPNNWRRAAVVISLIALVPIGLVLYVGLTDPRLADDTKLALHFRGVQVEQSMGIVFGATIGVWGVYMVRNLRREAFEARRLGQYQLRRKLGEGGMGEVYVGEHLLLKRPCAVKLIRPERAGDPEVLARFEREVRATARLSHWNSVEIFDFGRSEDGTFYYVMEYLPGLNLDQVVRMHGPLVPARVVHLLAQTCDALAEAHAEGLIHRDIKPANIFAAIRGRRHDVAKLLDFGLVRPLAADGANTDGSLTQEHALLGSPLYMSPEQALGAPANAQSDIYSLGAVAYFLLTGRPPFEGERPMKIILAHASKTPERPTLIRPEIPRDLESIVLRCLEKAPEDRFPDVEMLREALLGCDCAGDWSWEEAAEWWTCHGCPDKRTLDHEICGV